MTRGRAHPDVPPGGRRALAAHRRAHRAARDGRGARGRRDRRRGRGPQRRRALHRRPGSRSPAGDRCTPRWPGPACARTCATAAQERLGTAEPFAWIEGLRDRTRPAVDIEARRQAEDFVGDLLRRLDAARRQLRQTGPRARSATETATVEGVPALADLEKAIDDLFGNQRARRVLAAHPAGRRSDRGAPRRGRGDPRGPARGRGLSVRIVDINVDGFGQFHGAHLAPAPGPDRRPRSERGRQDHLPGLHPGHALRLRARPLPGLQRRSARWLAQRGDGGWSPIPHRALRRARAVAASCPSRMSTTRSSARQPLPPCCRAWRAASTATSSPSAWRSSRSSAASRTRRWRPASTAPGWAPAASPGWTWRAPSRARWRPSSSRAASSRASTRCSASWRSSTRS